MSESRGGGESRETSYSSTPEKTSKPKKKQTDLSAIREQAMAELYDELKGEVLAELKKDPEVLEALKSQMRDEMKARLLDDIARGKGKTKENEPEIGD